MKQVANEVAWLAHEVGEVHFKQGAPTESRVALAKLYVVFRPIEETEKNRGLLVQVEKKQQLKKFKPDVEEVFKKVTRSLRPRSLPRIPKRPPKRWTTLRLTSRPNPRQDKSFVEGCLTCARNRRQSRRRTPRREKIKAYPKTGGAGSGTIDARVPHRRERVFG